VLVDVAQGNPVATPCDLNLSCRRPITITVRNTGRRKLFIVGITIERFAPIRDWGPPFAPEPHRPLEPGSIVSVSIELWMPGEYRLVAVLRDSIGTEFGKEVEATSPQWVEARQACQRCGGEWGRFGLVLTERCMCRAPDAGKIRRGPKDCLGKCLFQKVEVVSPEAVDCNNSPCRHTPELVLPVGVCSEFTQPRGCQTDLLSWPTQPVERSEIQPIRMCFD
jgi:hypothetical protein